MHAIQFLPAREIPDEKQISNARDFVMHLKLMAKAGNLTREDVEPIKRFFNNSRAARSSPHFQEFTEFLDEHLY